MIQATIYMVPVGKARPRMTMKSGRAITYTPQKTAHAENVIRDKVMEFNTFYPRGWPISVQATFYRERPQHLPKRVTIPTTKPDWDNYAKLLMDALEHFTYENDSQISTAIIKKRFGSPPRIELIIDEDKGESQ